MSIDNEVFDRPPAPITESAEYEFSPVENQTISKTAKWAKVLGIILFVEAGVNLLDFDLSNLVSSVISIAIGLAFYRASESLNAVVNIQGNDVGFMMQAMDKLSTAFQIRIVLAILAIVFIGLALLVYLP